MSSYPLVSGGLNARMMRHPCYRPHRITVICLLLASTYVSYFSHCSNAANIPHKRSIYFEKGDHVIPESVSASATGHDGKHHSGELRMSSGMLESVLKAPPDAASAAQITFGNNKSHILRYGDPCQRIRCHIGHVCSVVHRKPRCVCGGESVCLHHTKKPVCGSDGHLYASHCELHRVACSRNVRIRIRHPSSTCVVAGTYNKSATEEEATTSRTFTTIPSTLPRKSVSRVDISEGSSLELRCDIRRDFGEIKWTRHDRFISEVVNNELEVLPNGALYLREVTVLHAGVYSCRDSSSSQDHILTVHTPPVVSVYPMTQFHTPGEIIKLQCSANGIPKPTVHWEVNESPLPYEPNHLQLQDENHTLTIVSSDNIVDTGAYKCKAMNSAGVAQDIATVFVEKVDVPKYINEPYEVFVVFHDLGYSVYNPRACSLQLEVESHRNVFRSHTEHASSLSSEHVSSLCRPGERCSWGDAVNVRNRFLYVSQPNLSRIVIIEISRGFKPLEVIATDRRPVQLNYIEHLDQVWVVCWSQEDPDGEMDQIKSSMIIRQASEDGEHHTVHTQPINNRFDAISEIFLPGKTGIHRDVLRYGYVTRHSDKQRLYKLDLETLRYVSEIDLRPQHCVPSAVSFIPLGGRFVIDCGGDRRHDRSSPSLIFDYLTDAILASGSTEDNVTSDSFVSPDGRLLTTTHPNRPTLSIFQVSDNGKLEHGLDVETSLTVANVVFFPSGGTENGYDIFGRLRNSDALLYVNSTSGKTATIKGTGYISIRDSHNYREIVTSGEFGNYLMMRSAKFLTVVDGKQRTVHCKWNNTRHASVIAWVEPLRL